MTQMRQSLLRRTASAIAVLTAVIGLTAGTAATASASADSLKKCYVDVYYEGHWITVEVECG